MTVDTSLGESEIRDGQIPRRKTAWVRLLLRVSSAIAAYLLSLVGVFGLIILRDHAREKDLQWGNGGEETVIGYLVFLFGPTLLISSIASVMLFDWVPAGRNLNWVVKAVAVALIPPLWLTPVLHISLNLWSVLLLFSLINLASWVIYLRLLRLCERKVLL